MSNTAAQIAMTKRASGIMAITRYRKATEAMTGPAFFDDNEVVVQEYNDALLALIEELHNK